MTFQAHVRSKGVEIVLSIVESEGMRDVWSSAQRRNQIVQVNPYLVPLAPTPLALVQSPYRTNSPRVLLKRKKEGDKNLRPENYHTAVTQRSQQNGVTSPNYDALIREFVPLPRLFDSPANLAKREYKKGSINGWRIQVTK